MVAENLTQEKIDLTPDSEQAPITPPVEEVKPEPDIPEVLQMLLLLKKHHLHQKLQLTMTHLLTKT